MRHFHGGNKKHWHIDYLLRNPHARPVTAIVSETRGASECSLARKILSDGRARVAHRRFGASDCTCKGHLVFVAGLGVSEVEKLVWEKFEELGIKPQRWLRVKD
jgi:Uri superfamily endonuclease